MNWNNMNLNCDSRKNNGVLDKAAKLPDVSAPESKNNSTISSSGEHEKLCKILKRPTRLKSSSSKEYVVITIILLTLCQVMEDCRKYLYPYAGFRGIVPRGIFAEATMMSEEVQESLCDGSLSFVTEIDEDKFSRASDSPSPVKFRFLRRNYLPYMPLKVVIYTEGGEDFNSLYIQAHEVGYNTSIGDFNSTYSDQDLSFISCNDESDFQDTVITEEDNFSKRSKITLYWNPPVASNKTVAFRINALTSDRPDQGWRGLTSDEILPKTKECHPTGGSEYRGTISHTRSGLNCQRWDSQSPHTHPFKQDRAEFTDKGLVNNYCRTPDSSSNPWCFTTSQQPRYELCEIPKCAADSNRQTHFVDFGEDAGDVTIPRREGEIGRMNFTSKFSMIKANYSSVAIFEDGVLVLGIDSESVDAFDLLSNGTFVLNSDAFERDRNTAVVAPFWTKITRNQSGFGQSYIYYRESQEPDVLLRLNDVIKENLLAKGKTIQEGAKATWAFIATWYLVGGNVSESDVQKLNTFQVVLTQFGNQSFVIFNYDMKKWTDKDNTALIGYKAGDAFRFLNHSLSYTRVSQLENALALGEAVSEQSNVNRRGQLMYEVSMCPADGGVCLDSLTLRLRLTRNSNTTASTNATTAQPSSSSSPTEQQSAEGRQRGDQNFCLNVDCGNNGTCSSLTGECECDPGFTGNQCETEIRACDSSPCQNGGTCNGTDRYMCACRPGFTGERCEDDINDCLNQPCKNGGICIDQENAYTCNCKEEYTGKHCEFLVDQCMSAPCKNGGTCNNTDVGFVCMCPPEYTGIDCSLSICFDGTTCRKKYSCFDKLLNKDNCTCKTNGETVMYCHEVLGPTEMPACKSSGTGSDPTGYISWPSTVSGGIAIASCPTPTTSDATRKCTASVWEDPDTSACGQLSLSSLQLQDLARSTIVAANASKVANQILNMTENAADEFLAYDIANVASILLKVIGVSGVEVSYEMSDDVINSISNIIDAPSEEIKSASMEFSSNSKLIRVVNQVLLKVELNSDEPVYLDSKNIKAGITKLNLNETFMGRAFSLSEDMKPVIANDSNASTSIYIPSSVTDGISSSAFDRIQFAVFASTALFDYAQVGNGTTEVTRSDSNFSVYSDYVISASVGETKIENLDEKIRITIPKSNNYDGYGPYCAFYQFPDIGGEGTWSTDGCQLQESTSTHTVCECDHLTNFAAIMDVYGTVEYLDKYQQMILRILTYIGCGLSIFGLLCTLISYTVFQKIRKEVPAKILICLCLALIAVNVVYLCMQAAYYSSQTTCVAVAAIMHYVLLSSLMWMGLEAINMYIAIVIVFNSYYRKYMLKMSLAGWGIPLLIVIIAFVIQFATGVPSYVMNSKTEICWLRREVFYATLVAPFGLVFLLNTVIYCLVLAQLMGMSSRKLKHLDSARKMRKPAKRENARKLRGAVGLMALLGISWGFALGTIDKAALTFAYVFVVFNSSQGFWVFIFHCVLKKEVCKSWKKLLFNKGKPNDGSSRWSRFSSSNTRGSRSTTMNSSRSMSASSIRTSYLVPKTSQRASKSEASIGLDSRGLDGVTRSNSSGYTNPVFDEPDPGPPPPFPPPPIPQEERIVRRVPRKTNPGPSTTIATQTDRNLLEPRDSDSDSSSNVEEERRDSIDDNFGLGNGGFRHPYHREVVMSPSNESGIYSDASVSSQVPLTEALRFQGTENRRLPRGITNQTPSGRVSLADARRSHDATPSSGSQDSVDMAGQSHDDSHSKRLKSTLSNDPKTTDSGISIASDGATDNSPSTSSRSAGSRPELLTQDSRSSLYSIHSNVSSSSAPSSGSESNFTANGQQSVPHTWKAPLVIRRSGDPNSLNGNDDNQKQPVSGLTSHQGNVKRALCKKNRKHGNSSGPISTQNKDTILSPSKRKIKRKLPKSQSLDEGSPHNNGSDVKMTDFSLNRGSFHDGTS